MTFEQRRGAPGQVVEVSLGDFATLQGAGIVAEVSVSPLVSSTAQVVGVTKVVRRSKVTASDESPRREECDSLTVAHFDPAPGSRTVASTTARETEAGKGQTPTRPPPLPPHSEAAPPPVNPHVIRDADDPLCAISSYGATIAPSATHAHFDTTENPEATLFARRRMLQPVADLIPPHQPDAVMLLRYDAKKPVRQQSTERSGSEAAQTDPAQLAVSAADAKRRPSPRFQPPENVSEAFPRRRPPPVPTNDDPEALWTAVPVANARGASIETLAQVAKLVPTGASRTDALLADAATRQQRHQLFDFPRASSRPLVASTPWSTAADDEEDDILEQWKAGLNSTSS